MAVLEVLVEEPSAEEAMRHLLPRILPARTRHKVINFGSKYKLLGVIDERMRGYAQRVAKGEDLRVVVTVDRDADDCMLLKQRMELAARRAGLPTKTQPTAGGSFYVVNRVVVEELESWFLGDVAALRTAFPKVGQLRADTGPFRNPDNGGSWEALHRVLRSAGVYRSSYPKIEAARRIAPHLSLENSRSQSFRAFRDGVLAAVA